MALELVLFILCSGALSFLFLALEFQRSSQFHTGFRRGDFALSLPITLTLMLKLLLESFFPIQYIFVTARFGSQLWSSFRLLSGGAMEWKLTRRIKINLLLFFFLRRG
ncbi:unnamed protein product, partial [Discosporangium mesarthrocarpum]